MFLQNVFHISLLFVTITTAVPSLNSKFDDHLPSLRLPREKVEKLKLGQRNPPGHVYRNITLGRGEDALTVPVVEINLDTLLDDEHGALARSLAPRGNCYTRQDNSAVEYCNIAYCWKASDGVTVYNEFITIQGSNGQIDPVNVWSSNGDYLTLDSIHNDADNRWFQRNHECSNDNTMIWTDHRWQEGMMGLARVDHVDCNTCDFGGLYCQSEQLQGNLAALANGLQPDVTC
jgi:hypothetical protein